MNLSKVSRGSHAYAKKGDPSLEPMVMTSEFRV